MTNLDFPQILANLSIVMGLLIGAKVVAKTVELPIPDEIHSGMTTESALSGISLIDQTAYLFSEVGQYLVETKFNLAGKTRDEKFGVLTDQHKFNLEDAKYPGTWKGAFTSKDRVFVWDANMLQILVLRSKDYKTVYSTTIPTDRIRPAADRMGEPTTKETQKARDFFKKASRRIFGQKYTGLVEMPKTWFKGSERKFFVTSKIEKFPLMIMNCKSDDPATCMLDRQCFLEGKSIKSTAGVGVVEDSKQVLIGHPDQHEISVFKYNSCFDVVYEKTLHIPVRLSKLKSLLVDGQGRLVIATASIDQFTNGNVFFWEPEIWNPK